VKTLFVTKDLTVSTFSLLQAEYIHHAKLARRRARRSARKESLEILTALKAASTRLSSKEFVALFNKLV
jgi:hypothetical protein